MVWGADELAHLWAEPVHFSGHSEGGVRSGAALCNGSQIQRGVGTAGRPQTLLTTVSECSSLLGWPV